MPDLVLKGKVIKLGDNISTDDIIPGRFAHLRSNLPELAKHVMEDTAPEFALTRPFSTNVPQPSAPSQISTPTLRS